MDGVDFQAISRWMRTVYPTLTGELDFKLIAGGRSNLTFEVTDQNGISVILRRPPTSHVLPTAHDMRREFEIISALDPTPVPVPHPIALCEDQSIAENPFYLMSLVPGHILKDRATVEADFTPTQRNEISASLVDTLVTLHSVDPEAVGLGGLGRKEGYIDRQLKRWHTQYTKSSEEISEFVPLVDEVHASLSRTIPKQSRTGIVHGDYRLDNTMIGFDNKVAAVLDWEICTLGDPMADLGLLLVYWAEVADSNAPLGTVTSLPGFFSRDEIVKRYQEASGVDTSLVAYYVAFGYWKLACILQGVHSRYIQGATGGDTSDAEAFADQVIWLAESASEALSKI